ncbi:MAG: M48 family metalloprotease, partial [Candidatus Dormibacteria bacterium]
MRRRWPLAALALTLVAVSCLAGFLLRSCPEIGTCITASVRPQRLLSALGVTAAGAATLAFVTWAVRLLWIVVQASRGAALLGSVACPPLLAAAVRRTGVDDVVCLGAAGVHAFCAGPIRPRLYLTEGLLTSLEPEELDAVLLHEAEHQRRRDPLRRATRRALAEVLFFLPILEWW